MKIKYLKKYNWHIYIYIKREKEHLFATCSMLVSLLAYPWAPKMEICSSETSVGIIVKGEIFIEIYTQNKLESEGTV
jgi:hypothetical protein